MFEVVGGFVDGLNADDLNADDLNAEDRHAFAFAHVLDRTRVLIALRNRVDAELARTVRAGELGRAPEQDGLTSMRSWLRGHARLSNPTAPKSWSSGPPPTTRHSPRPADVSAPGCSIAGMASFSDIETEEPAFAARVKAAFDAHGHKILATLRRNGAPRVSGIEARFTDGELWLAGMPRSVKFVDLRRDPRMALHSGSDEPDAFTADAKVSGRAVEVTDPGELAAFAGAGEVPTAAQPFELFRIDLDQVVLTAVSEAKDALIISSWQPGRGLSETRRT
jgi:hypothetical protein